MACRPSPSPRSVSGPTGLSHTVQASADGRSSTGIMEDHPQGGAASVGHRRDAVTHADAVIAVVALTGPLTRGEDDEGALRRGGHAGGGWGAGPLARGDDDEGALRGGEHVGAALRAGPLLHQHELAALIVDAAARQDSE